MELFTINVRSDNGDAYACSKGCFQPSTVFVRDLRGPRVNGSFCGSSTRNVAGIVFGFVRDLVSFECQRACRCFYRVPWGGCKLLDVFQWSMWGLWWLGFICRTVPYTLASPSVFLVDPYDATPNPRSMGSSTPSTAVFFAI